MLHCCLVSLGFLKGAPKWIILLLGNCIIILNPAIQSFSSNPIVELAGTAERWNL